VLGWPVAQQQRAVVGGGSTVYTAAVGGNSVWQQCSLAVAVVGV